MLRLSINDIKLKQYVLIAKAGRTMTTMKEKNISLLEYSIFEELMIDFAPVISKKLPSGQLPSGKSMSEVLTAVRKEIFDNYHEAAEKKSKAAKGYTRHRFVESWFPVEWEVFTKYGSATLNPEEYFNAR